jgi:NADPH:quinone reductase-like Zn-dependent oxidoreductase
MSPEYLSYEKLACVLWSYSTVWHMISGRARLQAGESVLVTGASGGMGSAAIQVAKLVGDRPIIALSSQPAKEASLREAGADVVLNYRVPMFWSRFAPTRRADLAWMWSWTVSVGPTWSSSVWTP